MVSLDSFLARILLYGLLGGLSLASLPAANGFPRTPGADTPSTTNSNSDAVVRLGSGVAPTESPAEQELLARASAAGQDLYATLKSFVCNERVERFKGRISSNAARQVDSVTARLSFENGAEHYTNLRQKDRPLTALADLTGAWSEGEFGTLLKQTGQLLRSQPVSFVRWGEVDGAAAGLYQFEVTTENSPWDLLVSGRHFIIPFFTEVWISRSSGQILKIMRTSLSVPAELHISEINWEVTLGRVDLNARTWLLPKEASYQVLYRETNRREWNTMHFSDYHRYGSEVALRFN